MLRALVLEDERPARSYLVELVEASGLAQVDVAVALPAHAEAGLGGVEVAFVDVNLVGAPGAQSAGLEFIRRARQRPGAPDFILTTADPSHALTGYELGVLDYLLKPFTGQRVNEALARVKARRAPVATSPPTERRVVARRGRSLVFLSGAEVLAFEAEGRLCFVHVDGERLDVDLSLAALEAVFTAGFTRVHRSWLVSTRHVRELVRDEGDVRLKLGRGGLEVPVARERATEVRELLLRSAVGLDRT